MWYFVAEALGNYTVLRLLTSFQVQRNARQTRLFGPRRRKRGTKVPCTVLLGTRMFSEDFVITLTPRGSAVQSSSSWGMGGQSFLLSGITNVCWHFSQSPLTLLQGRENPHGHCRIHKTGDPPSCSILSMGWVGGRHARSGSFYVALFD